MREMKDSGIEWVGNIPATWKSIQIKNLFTILSGATPTPDTDNWDGDVLWITPADYKTKDKYVSGGKRNISQQGFNTCSTSMIPKGSIIFSKRAPIGTVAINTEVLCTNQGCLSCVSKADTCNDYYYYVMSVGINEWIIDIKDMDNEIYKRYTGVPIDNMLENLSRITDIVDKSKLHIRVPRIKEFNKEENVNQSVEKIRKFYKIEPEVFDYYVVPEICGSISE